MNKKKKILIISAVFPPEPVVSANISFEIANYLSDKYQTVVISPKPSRPSGYLFSNHDNHFNFKHIITESYICPKSNIVGRFLESYGFGRECAKEIITNNYDVIYMNSWPLAAQYLCVKAAKKKKVSIITHVQDIYPESLISKLPLFKNIISKLLLPIDIFTLNNSTKIITISNNMKGFLCGTRNVLPTLIDVVYNWQNEEHFTYKNKISLDKKEFVFMFLGSLSPSASLDVLVKAFIEANLNGSKLVIAGNGSEKRKLEKLISESNSNIEIIDASPENAGKIQSMSDVLILPLKKGVGKLALPSKLTAYMFSSKPIIASVDLDSDSAKIILESDCGWVVEPESINQLSELIINVYRQDKASLNKKGDNGYIYATKYFTKQENLNKIICLIESL